MDRALLRITKELAEFQKNSDLAIAVAFKDDDVRNVRAMIMGPHETPYEFGFFEFSIKFPPEYPSKAPQVVALTTNNGQCRFNPNIYSGGKVCLSILGTWRGESGEQWSSAQGLESVLLSIQSLMSANPYANEPGYENSRHDKDGVLQKKYVEKIRHETIRISIIQRLEHYFGLEKEQPARNPGVPDFTKPFLNGSEEQEDLLEALPESPQERYYPEDLDPAAEPFEPFIDLCKRRFLWYYDSYMATIQTGKAENPDKTAFTMMPFEGRSGGPGSNCMPGKFSYTTLEKRMLRVKDALCEETRQWAIAGLREKEHDTYVAANLQHQFEQIVAHLKLENSSLDVSLEDGNPFVWLVTYFGKPMTNLDGGLFRLKMCFSPRFPKEQARVRVETKIFHQAVASDGTLCYIPNPLKMEDVRVHIEAAITALEDESPRYDPRKIVNPEASRLYWGKPEDKKVYSRRLRRAAQQSMEDFPE